MRMNQFYTVMALSVPAMVAPAAVEVEEEAVDPVEVYLDCAAYVITSLHAVIMDPATLDNPEAAVERVRTITETARGRLVQLKGADAEELRSAEVRMIAETEEGARLEQMMDDVSLYLDEHEELAECEALMDAMDDVRRMMQRASDGEDVSVDAEEEEY